MRRPARTTLPVRVTAASFGLCESVCMDSVNGRMNSVKRGCLSPTPRHQCQTAGLPGPDCAYRGEQPGPVGRPLGWSAGRAPAAMNCFRVELFPSRDDCVCGSGQIDIVSQGLQAHIAHIAAGRHVTSRRFHALVVEKTLSEKPGRWLARPRDRHPATELVNELVAPRGSRWTDGHVHGTGIRRPANRGRGPPAGRRDPSI